MNFPKRPDFLNHLQIDDSTRRWWLITLFQAVGASIATSIAINSLVS